MTRQQENFKKINDLKRDYFLLLVIFPLFSDELNRSDKKQTHDEYTFFEKKTRNDILVVLVSTPCREKDENKHFWTRKNCRTEVPSPTEISQQQFDFLLTLKTDKWSSTLTQFRLTEETDINPDSVIYRPIRSTKQCSKINQTTTGRPTKILPLFAFLEKKTQPMEEEF